jgi:hypothetical protein
MIKVRKIALDNFGLNSLHSGRPLSDLQEILIPLYYSYRYQAAAAAKWIGGNNYQYSIKDDQAKTNLNSKVITPVSAEEQKRAIEAILETLSPDFLMIDNQLNKLLLPKAYGYSKSRESLTGRTGTIFDRVQLAAASIQHSLSLLLEPSRLERMIQQNSENSNIPNISELESSLHDAIWNGKHDGTEGLIKEQAIDLTYSNLLNLIHSDSVGVAVKSRILTILEDEKKHISKRLKRNKRSGVQKSFLNYQLKRLENLSIKTLEKKLLIKLPKMPPGSPI